ncbi:hypothetical protein [Lacihabitans sp. CCS-44]|uniref:hypothetical protein n=1 Tax=Lacihabitans sp. CCS-44 TaxID=2487331 RepID=UPI0020CF6D67|nr:hypothetical protein [Lacihabitans sp. CCS-44]
MKKNRWYAELTKTDWIAITVLSLGLIGMFSLPLVVTQINSEKWNLGVSKANEIGDSIGGVLSPFVGYMSAILIYLALREQIKANKILGDQINTKSSEKVEKVIKNVYLEQLDKILSSIENYHPFSYSDYYDEDDYLRETDFFQSFQNENSFNLVTDLIIYNPKLLKSYGIQIRPIIKIINDIKNLLKNVMQDIEHDKSILKEIEIRCRAIINLFNRNSFKKIETEKLEDLSQLIYLNSYLNLLDEFLILKKKIKPNATNTLFTKEQVQSIKDRFIKIKSLKNNGLEEKPSSLKKKSFKNRILTSITLFIARYINE